MKKSGESKSGASYSGYSGHSCPRIWIFGDGESSLLAEENDSCSGVDGVLGDFSNSQ